MSLPAYVHRHLGRFGSSAGPFAAGAGAGLSLGLVMPRGPMTSGQSLTALSVALGAGVLAGWISRSRWSALFAPLALVAGFELARLGTQGPSVGPIHLDGVYGVVVFIAGRGFDAFVNLLPMVARGARGAPRHPRAGDRGCGGARCRARPTCGHRDDHRR